MTTPNTSHGWYGFDFMGFSVAGEVWERMSPDWPWFDYRIEAGELTVGFGRRLFIVTPPWWKSPSERRKASGN